MGSERRMTVDSGETVRIESSVAVRVCCNNAAASLKCFDEAEWTASSAYLSQISVLCFTKVGEDGAL